MKRRELIRHLEANGCMLVRDNGPHSIYRNTLNGRTSAVPRHTEIHRFLVRKICRDLGIAQP